MTDVLIALVPAAIWSVYAFGYRSVTILLVSVIFSVLFELLYQLIMKKPLTVTDFSATVTGVLLAFCLPVTIPLWMVIIGDFFAVVIVKQLFGGIGRNIVNPAICARIFLFVSFPGAMSSFVKPESSLSAFALTLKPSDIDAVASATPLAMLKQGQFPSESLLDLLFGKNAGCIGEVSVLMLLVGAIYLLVRRVITWHIPVSYILTVAIITYFFPRNSITIEFMLNELLTGGLVLGAFFMATDYVTSPATPNGRLIYGAGCGVLTVFIRYFGGYPEGVSFAILIMNLFVWYLDRYTKPVRFGGDPK